MKNVKTLPVHFVWGVIPLTLLVLSFSSLSEEKGRSKKTTYIIETLVEGSQEQPNVIYITPWQENEQAINIHKPLLEISLPKAVPIVPKAFNKKLNIYNKQEIERNTQ
jgi:hypothetical protein